MKIQVAEDGTTVENKALLCVDFGVANEMNIHHDRFNIIVLTPEQEVLKLLSSPSVKLYLFKDILYIVSEEQDHHYTIVMDRALPETNELREQIIKTKNVVFGIIDNEHIDKKMKYIQHHVHL